MPSSSSSSDDDETENENDVGGPPSTPIRPAVDKEDEDDEDCWIPTPPVPKVGASRAGNAALPVPRASARAPSSSSVAGSDGPADNEYADCDDDDDDDRSRGVPSSDVTAGSLRRRLAETDTTAAAAAAAAAARANGYHPNDAAVRTNANPAAETSLLDGLHAAVAPPLLSALLFLTQTSVSTTAQILAPPLHLTRTILLPALYYGLVDLWDATTPTRIKDWCAIWTKSAHHLWEVVIASPHGQQFRGRVGRVGGDVVDVLATPAARQVVVETTATLIKVGEALHTPEFRALLDQCAVLGCRCLDAATTGAAKRLVGDVAEMAWTGVELLVSRDTAVGLAECCAYLCHALEMEHGVWREGRAGAGVGGRRRRGQPTGDGRGEDHHEDRAEAARRRRERARRNARLYGSEGDTTIEGGANGGGIEEAILASLGDAYRIYEKNGDDADEGASRHDVDVDGTMSLPSRVVVQSPTGANNGGGGGGDELGNGLEPPSTGGGAGKDHDHDHDDGCSSIGSGGDHADDHGAPGNSSFANEACDVEFLRRRISQRARTMEAEQKRYRRGDGGEVVDIEEASNVSEFYRLVDQISSERQAEAVSNILDEEEEERTDAASNAPSKRKFYSRAAAAAGAGNEQGQDTLKSRLEAYVSRRSRERAGIGVGGKARSTSRTSRGILGNTMVVWILILWFLLGCAVIGGFSCYGIYVFVFAPAMPPTMASVPLLRRLVGRGGRRGIAAPESTTATMPQQRSPVPTEIVVRIVREVVHVAPDGSAYAGGETKLDGMNMNEADTLALEEKIAEAAVGALQNLDVKTGLEGEESRPADISREL